MEKVLIIEDNDVIARLWKVTLETEGFEVSTAVSGKEGLKLAMEQKPQVILLDIMMPNMDGFTILRNLKECEETVNIPVIVLSNLSQSEDIQQAKKLGAVDFIVKFSILPEQLVNKIKYIITTSPS